MSGGSLHNNSRGGGSSYCNSHGNHYTLIAREDDLYTVHQGNLYTLTAREEHVQMNFYTLITREEDRHTVIVRGTFIQ